MFKQNCWSRLHSALSPAIVLLLLIWITPVVAEPTSPNDPLRAIALRAQKPPDPPICCLKPLQPLESVEDDLLVSFEEWKARHLHGSENASSPNPPSSRAKKSGDGTGNGKRSVNVEDAALPPPAATEDQQQLNVPAKAEEISAQISPHFRVPLVDRFNYASLDCSARVYKAHKGAKHPSNVLASKKDRYMLSPCKTNGEKQFIVIELCEDIRIDTVQLANFEFFSGVFKDFTISVAKTSESEWTTAGTYKAKNIRGVQSFHTPTSLRDFYRYLRIDFHSHYGSEYYCPLSLVRVYGLTHLEEWKWELWEAESRAKLEAALKDAAIKTVDTTTATGDAASLKDINQTVLKQTAVPSTTLPSINGTNNKVIPPSTVVAAEPSVIHSTDTYLSSSTTITQPPSLDHSPPLATTTTSIPPSSPAPSSSVAHSYTTPHDATPSSGSPYNVTNGTSAAASTTSVVASSPLSRISSPSIVLTPTPLATQSHPFLPIPISGGESIYRTIMNRLVGIERNHTLYKEYMAQQQLVVREALKRLSEDIGRLEGLGKAQRQAHDRAVLEWEKQRKQWQMEHAHLLQRLEYLSDEINMEKRLGVAQLCLLLAVLVFMGLTRGSRGPVIEDYGQWRTTLKSLSGDWRRPRIKEAEDLRAFKREGEHVEFPKSAPGKIPVDFAGSSSSADADAMAPELPRYPLTSVDLNYPSLPRHRTRRSADENQRLENDGQNTSILLDSSNTPSRTRSRTTSRSRSRTSSWPSKSTLFHPGTPSSRQATENRGGQASRSAVTGTPSKGTRVAGVYLSGRPGLPSMRNSPYVLHQRRAAPLQRSHSSHGPPGSIDYALGQTWTGSGSALKSARKWARTAHLHEVRGRWRENFGYEQAVVMNGVKGGESDVFGSSTLASTWTPGNDLNRKREKPPIMRGEEADTDADGWESASDVGVDSIEGF